MSGSCDSVAEHTVEEEIDKKLIIGLFSVNSCQGVVLNTYCNRTQRCFEYGVLKQISRKQIAYDYQKCSFLGATCKPQGRSDLEFLWHRILNCRQGLRFITAWVLHVDLSFVL